MNLPPNATAVGDHAYLFESPAGPNVPDCFISAHGGDASFLADGYYSITDKLTEFTVPAGCTVYFFADINAAHDSGRHGGGRAGNLKAIASKGLTPNAKPPLEAKNTFTAGVVCTDYVLGKNLGSHGGTDNPTYFDMCTALDDVHNDGTLALKWLPHFVTIRNRTGLGANKYIFLSRLIKEIRRDFNHVVNFYCANCRNRINTDSRDPAKKLRKNAGKPAYQG